MENPKFLNDRVIIRVGDITRENVDAIVNAANWTLLGGGGVDGAIHKVGGAQIYEECKKLRETLYPKGLPTGEAVITTGGNLKAEFVIHTVGPIRGIDKENEAAQLADCYRNSLELAKDRGLTTIAFPSISTGAYGYPKHEAALIVSTAIKDFLETDSQIEEVRLVFFSQSDALKFIKHQVF
ncbi:MAG: O-acetyl-ADP-ribose deacetylase [Pyrinomonadaceae bacterium]|nr:O-acetyl-ADP-ribose deacetylase [Pyrinomonadaceae bacterium]